MRRSATAFAPATVANLACGFDVLGLALEAPGDRVTAELTGEAGVSLASVSGDGGRLPREAQRNTATVAVQKLLDRHPPRQSTGIGIHLEKGLPLASGMGSSAASAVAAVVAVHELLELDCSPTDLLLAALEGERLVSGSPHADNASACLLGGFVLVRSVEPVDVVRLPFPRELAVALLRPHFELSTRDSRGLLGDSLRLADAVTQWANVGALVAALHAGDLELLSRSLVDVVAEPRRSARVPGFSDVKRAALEAGALGASLSGSGPSTFALCRNGESAHAVSAAMRRAFSDATGLAADVHVSGISSTGAHIVSETEEP